MYGLNDLNPEAMRAELAYRRERLSGEQRAVPTGLGRWLRDRRRRTSGRTY